MKYLNLIGIPRPAGRSLTYCLTSSSLFIGNTIQEQTLAAVTYGVFFFLFCFVLFCFLLPLTTMVANKQCCFSCTITITKTTVQRETFVGQNFRVSGRFPISGRKLSQMGRGLHGVTWSHLLYAIATNHKDCRRMVSTPALEATTSTRMFGKLPSVNCYLARENLVISMIHMPWLLLRQVQKLGFLAMYRVPYLRFAACFPICSFSGVKCWYSDRLDATVAVVTSHVTTAYNFARRKLSRIGFKPRSSRTFSPSKVSRYKVCEQAVCSSSMTTTRQSMLCLVVVILEEHTACSHTLQRETFEGENVRELRGLKPIRESFLRAKL